MSIKIILECDALDCYKKHESYIDTIDGLSFLDEDEIEKMGFQQLGDFQYCKTCAEKILD